MNFLTDLKSKVQWKLLYEFIQTLVAGLRIILECLPNIVVQRYGYVMLLLQFAKIEQLLL